jgi:hypothetical protein
MAAVAAAGSVAVAASLAAWQQRGVNGGSTASAVAAAGSASAARWRRAWPRQRCRSGDEDTSGNSNGGGTDNNQQ